MSLNKKAVFAAAISACATPAGSAWDRLTASPIDDAACCAMAPLRPDGSAIEAL